MTVYRDTFSVWSHNKRVNYSHQSVFELCLYTTQTLETLKCLIWIIQINQIVDLGPWTTLLSSHSPSNFRQSLRRLKLLLNQTWTNTWYHTLTLNYDTPLLIYKHEAIHRDTEMHWTQEGLIQASWTTTWTQKGNDTYWTTGIHHQGRNQLEEDLAQRKNSIHEGRKMLQMQKAWTLS